MGGKGARWQATPARPPLPRLTLPLLPATLRRRREMTGVIPTTPVSDGLAAALALDGLHDKVLRG